MLPGLHGTKGLFRPLNDVAPNTFDILTIEYPYHEKQSYQQLLPLVTDVLQGISGRYVLLGESFGGPLAILISANKPKGLIGTILVASFVSAPNLSIGRYLPWTAGFTLTQPLYALRHMLSGHRHADLISLISTELQKVTPSVLTARIHEVYNVNVKAQLETCTIPFAYFQGRHDLVVPRKNLKNILAVKPKTQVFQFDTDHLILQNAPVEAWWAISTFVTTLLSK